MHASPCMDSCGTIIDFNFSNCNKLELKRKMEFRELMYNMTGMGGDMT